MHTYIVHSSSKT